MKKNVLILTIIMLVLSCSNAETNTKKATKDALSNLVTYKEDVNNKIYFESDAYKMILFAMKKEQTLEPHSAPMDTPLLMLEGEAKIMIGQDAFDLSQGESIVLPKNIDHAVYPTSDIKFVLIK
nr:cupin domain-containing protein [uncultured Psychroserpens sp.]